MQWLEKGLRNRILVTAIAALRLHSNECIIVLLQHETPPNVLHNGKRHQYRVFLLRKAACQALVSCWPSVPWH